MGLCSAAALSEPETGDLDLVPVTDDLEGGDLGGDDLEGAETHYRSYYYRPRYYR